MRHRSLKLCFQDLKHHDHEDEQEIKSEGEVGLDLQALSTAIQDRRLLVEWLRELHFPPASLYNDCGITEAVEELLLRETC